MFYLSTILLYFFAKGGVVFPEIAMYSFPPLKYGLAPPLSNLKSAVSYISPFLNIFSFF